MPFKSRLLTLTVGICNLCRKHVLSLSAKGIPAIMDMAMEPPAMGFYNICGSDDFDLAVRLGDGSQDVVKGRTEELRPLSIR